MTNYEMRKGIIDALQKKRKSVVVTYFNLTDRANTPQYVIGDDAIRPLHALLEQIGHQNTIDLFIYTRGGSMMAAYNIVKLFREYTDKFNVIIPFRAHSGGTQIALGADSISMSKIGQLSPVDPSTANQFNPILNPTGNPTDPRNRKPISVEDVQAYLNLSRERVGLVSEDDRLEVFKELTKYYEPLALGNVNRVYMETRLIAKEVLSLHMREEKDPDKIDAIVKALTETYTHDFLISRDLAEKIGLKIIRPTPEEEGLIMRLYDSYESEMKMNIPFDADAIIAARRLAHTQALQPSTPQAPQQVQTVMFKIKLAAIESLTDSFTWVTDGSIIPPAQCAPQGMPPQMGLQIGVPSVMLKLGRWYNITELEGMSFE